MKRCITLALLVCLISNGLFAQKKIDNPIEPYLALMVGYSSSGAISFNSEYQYRYKHIGLTASLGVEYATSYNGIGIHYSVGQFVFHPSLSGHNVFDSKTRWLNIIPAFSGYYYLGQKGKWEGFFKSGVLFHYNAWYDYKGLEYKTDFMGKVIEEGFTPVNQTTNSIDLQSINWLIGGGFQYQMSKKINLRMTSEIQWGRGIFILGGLSFKI